jgi:ribosomal protein L11 methyltransferase
LGARRVLALDIDPEALGAARINLVKNGVDSVMAVSAVPLERVEETFDLVVANLTAALLTSMAGGLTDRVGGTGRLLIAGILAEQLEEVIDCFHRLHFKVVESRALEEWRAILLRR